MYCTIKWSRWLSISSLFFSPHWDVRPWVRIRYFVGWIWSCRWCDSKLYFCPCSCLIGTYLWLWFLFSHSQTPFLKRIFMKTLITRSAAPADKRSFQGSYSHMDNRLHQGEESCMGGKSDIRWYWLPVSFLVYRSIKILTTIQHCVGTLFCRSTMLLRG